MTDTPLSIRDDIVAFEAMRAALEADHLGKWVLFYNRELIDFFDNFDDAAKLAVERFGKGPYLIRRIGAHTVTLPASVMYGPLHAVHPLRI
jgi:hypothetical protein